MSKQPAVKPVPVRKKGQQINRVHIRFKTERKAKYHLTRLPK